MKVFEKSFPIFKHNRWCFKTFVDVDKQIMRPYSDNAPVPNKYLSLAWYSYRHLIIIFSNMQDDRVQEWYSLLCIYCTEPLKCLSVNSNTKLLTHPASIVIMIINGFKLTNIKILLIIHPFQSILKYYWISTHNSSAHRFLWTRSNTCFAADCRLGGALVAGLATFTFNEKRERGQPSHVYLPPDESYRLVIIIMIAYDSCLITIPLMLLFLW